MLWLFKAHCNSGCKQCVVVETKQKSLNPNDTSKSSGLFLGKCFCSLQYKKGSVKPICSASNCLRYTLCGVDMDSTAAGEHHETLHDRVFKRGDWGTEMPWLTFMGALRPLSLASGRVWAPDFREETKTTYDFYYGALGFDTAHASVCTHQPLWGHFSPKPPSSRRRMEPPRLDVALRETGQDGLHCNTMGWLSMGSVCWGQLPAWGVKCVTSPQPSPHQTAAIITAINLYH